MKTGRFSTSKNALKNTMKSTLCISLSLLALTAVRASAAAALIFGGPVTFHLTVSAQDLNNDITHSNQVHTAASTNQVVITKSTFTNATITSAGMLQLLENSFHTNFPAGSKLASDRVRFYIVDSTGTNVVLDVTPVFTISNEVLLSSQTATESEKITATATNISGHVASAVAQVMDLFYDDSTQTTTDGTHTAFRFSGLANIPTSQNLATLKIIANLSLLNGAGSGTNRNTPVVIQGSMTVPLRGVVE